MKRNKKHIFYSFIFLSILALPALFIVLTIPFKEIEVLKNGHVTVDFVDGKVQYYITKSKPLKWTALKDISKELKNAIVISEDWGFYQHKGIDFNQIREAVKEKINGRKKLRGASTISQQVVKNLFLTGEYSFARKAKEALITIYLEKIIGKDKVLEIYLNIAQTGKKLYGVNQASRFYFNKLPSQMTPKESAFIAMLLPSPIRYGQSFRKKKMSEFANKTVDSILKKMVRAKMITDQEYEDSKEKSYLWEKKKEAVKARETAKNLEQKIKRSPQSISDGEEYDYEGHLKNDPDLALNSMPDFDDDDAIVDDVKGIGDYVELSLE